jgi:transcriptional regulator with XRE-family HTH domain
MDRQLFGAAIRIARKHRGLTLDAMSGKTRLCKGYLSGIENGKVNPPIPAAVIRLAKHLGLPERELILLAYVSKAPKAVRDVPEFVEFRDKVVASCRGKNMLGEKPEGAS